MSIAGRLLQFAGRYGDDIIRKYGDDAIRLLGGGGDDAARQTNLFNKSGGARNFTSPGQAANRAPTTTPISTRAAEEAIDTAVGMPRPVAVPRRTPGQMEIPGTQQPFTGGPPRPVSVATPPRAVQPQAPRPEFPANSAVDRMSRGPMQVQDPGTAQSIREMAERASLSTGRQITPDMLTGPQGTAVLRNLDVSDLARVGGAGGGLTRQAAPGALRRSGPIVRAGADDVIDATIDPVAVRVIERGGMPRISGMPMSNARNASRGLQVGDLSIAGSSLPRNASPQQRALAENMARETLDGFASRLSNSEKAMALAGAGLITGAVGVKMHSNFESNGPGSVAESQMPVSEPTISTPMGQVTADADLGGVNDPGPSLSPEMAAQVQDGMDTGAASLDPIPQYVGPQASAPIQTRGNVRQDVSNQAQQSQMTGLSKLYAERAAMATAPGTNDATVAELQKLGVLNTPELAMWGKSNPTLAYDLLERTKASRPTLPSQQAINMTGTQMISPMGSDVERNMLGNTEAVSKIGTSYGADMKAATQPYNAPVLMPVGKNAMYGLQGRLSY